MTTKRVLAAVAVLALIGAGVFAASEARARKTPEVRAFAAPAVQLAAVRPVRTTQHETVTGSLQPAKALQLGFEVGGRLVKVAGARGARVGRGQVLAQLDTEMVEAQVLQAEAALRAAEAQAALARDASTRQAKLREGGSVSEWQSSAAESQARAADAGVAVARAALAQARAARGKHALRAPFDATLVEAPDQIGATVGPGMPLFTLEQLDTLTLKITVPEQAHAALRPGMRLRVESINGGGATDDARVRAVIPSADPGTRRVPVDISVPNGNRAFLAHSLARATLPLGEERLAAALPATALLSAGGDHVFVLDGDGSRRKLPVTVLERGASEVIVAGLPADSRVIDSPAP